MTRATRMASAKIKARAKGNLGFPKSSEDRAEGLAFAARGAADRDRGAMVDLWSISVVVVSSGSFVVIKEKSHNGVVKGCTLSFFG